MKQKSRRPQELTLTQRTLGFINCKPSFHLSNLKEKHILSYFQIIVLILLDFLFSLFMFYDCITTRNNRFK